MSESNKEITSKNNKNSRVNTITLNSKLNTSITSIVTKHSGEREFNE